MKDRLTNPEVDVWNDLSVKIFCKVPVYVFDKDLPLPFFQCFDDVSELLVNFNIRSVVGKSMVLR
jgi:hypothetical protein